MSEVEEPKPYGGDKFIAAAMKAIHGEDSVETAASVETQAEADAQAIADAEAAKLVEQEAQNQLQVDIDKIISEKTGGKYSKLEDLVAAPKEISVEPKFENEESKKVYELLLAGKTDEVYNILHEQKFDYKTLGDIEAIKIKNKKDKPYLSEEDLSDLISDQYGVGEEITEDDRAELTASQLKEKEARIARNARALKRDASEARSILDVAKSEIKLPDLQRQPENVVDQDAAANQAAIEAWITQTDEGAKAIPSVLDYNFSVDVMDGENKISYTTPFKIEGDDRKALDNAVRNFIPPLGSEADYVKDGKVDIEKIKEESMDRLFGKKAYSILLKDSIAKTKQSVIEGIKNIENGTSAPAPTQELSHEEWLQKRAMHT